MLYKLAITIAWPELECFRSID